MSLSPNVKVNVGTKYQLAFILWSGDLGGAEVLSASLAERIRRLGIDVNIVFITQPQPLADRLVDMHVPYKSLGFKRGREVVRHPRRYAAEVARSGADGALLVDCGFMGAALRAGGYGGPIIAVEHGGLLEAQSRPWPQRLFWWLSRICAVWADDAEVAVSDFILDRMRQHPHLHTAQRIYNGIDPTPVISAAVLPAYTGNRECVVAFAGRLVRGKGADYLIEAVARLQSTRLVNLVVAGDGPERARLEALADSLGVERRVEFLGFMHDMPAFWHACDVAVVPSAEFTESCPLTPLEAMALKKPVVATRNGGIPELVVDGETGILVPPGDIDALVSAISLYVESRDLRMRHGLCGQARVASYFHINDCVQAYLHLFNELAVQSSVRTERRRSTNGELSDLT